MNARLPAAGLVLLVLLGAGPGPLDSQDVLQRYALALAGLPVPKTVVFSYTVSQVGPSSIEQSHRVYRSGNAVRDETLAVDGVLLHGKVVSFSRHEDRYTVARFAPRSDAYELLFLGTTNDGRHLDYVYEATPVAHAAGSFVDRLTVDGITFLPRAVRFRTSGLGVDGTGEVRFAPFGKYWMPVSATAQARVKDKPAHERIVWSDYRFPESLPPSTFQSPKPLPVATLPPV